MSSTLVVLRDGATGPSRQTIQARAGAVRGTSAFLGVKARDQRAMAKRSGRPPPESLGGPAGATPEDTWSQFDAPPLYHGLPSSKEADEVPYASTMVIKDLESELSALEGRLLRRDGAPLAGAEARVREREAAPTEPQGPSPATHLDDMAAEGPAETPRRWDEFGRDSQFLERFAPVARFLTERYFRTVVTGIEHLPAQGPCLLVANHSGALPIDGLVLKSAIWAAHPKQRHVRWLTEDFVQNLPFVGTMLQRLGAVRASRENALGLLQSGECVVAFPEGVKGYAKPIAQWYRVQRLGRGRIIGLCIEAGVPLLPCAIVGAEEATPSLQRLEAVERLLGTPYFPITPTFPWLGPLGLLPAPTRWSIDIGPSFLTRDDAARADDPLYVADLTERLRGTLQQRLDRLVARRKSTWFG